MASAGPRNVVETPDPAAWLDRHGDALYRYAVLHLADSAAAEDVVQEALLAAFESFADFRHQSSERTWLIGILRHKVIDHVRRSVRDGPSSKLDASAGLPPGLFDSHGLWETGPKSWGRDPAKSFERAEFWDVYLSCLGKLPERMALVFSLRELDGEKTERICELLDLSSTNLWTMLHRARMRLRTCLEENWFDRQR